MNDQIRRVAFFIALLLPAACVPSFINLSVAPSSEVIRAGGHDMQVLVRDYDAVLGVAAKWAAANKGEEKACSNLRFGGVGVTSPGCRSFRFPDLSLDVTLEVPSNSTRLHIIGRTESVEQAGKQLTAEMTAAFGPHAVIEPRYTVR